MMIFKEGRLIKYILQLVIIYCQCIIKLSIRYLPDLIIPPLIIIISFMVVTTNYRAKDNFYKTLILNQPLVQRGHCRLIPRFHREADINQWNTKGLNIRALACTLSCRTGI